MYIFDFRRGIAFPAETLPAIDSEPIFAMDLFFNFMRKVMMISSREFSDSVDWSDDLYSESY